MAVSSIKRQRKPKSLAEELYAKSILGKKSYLRRTVANIVKLYTLLATSRAADGYTSCAVDRPELGESEVKDRVVKRLTKLGFKTAQYHPNYQLTISWYLPRG